LRNSYIRYLLRFAGHSLLLQNLPHLHLGVHRTVFPTLNHIIMQRFAIALLGASVALAAPTASIKRATVSGSAEGFASGVTGGGDAAAVTPTSTDELVSYLGDSQPRVIILNQEFDFTDSEGTTTSAGCSPWGTGSQCQIAINQNDWCANYEPDAPTVSSITYNKAGVEGITVASDKTIVGEGSKGVIKGKG
jgi:pectin lyase